MFEYIAKVIRVVDGDTLEVEVDLGFKTFRKERIRLLRVDTPEIYGVKKESVEYQQGTLASKFTKDWVEATNSNIRIVTVKDRTGKYGRYLAEVYAIEGPQADSNLQDLLIEAGHSK